MVTVQEFVKRLDLEELLPSKQPEMHITSSDLNRPGLQFCGYFDYFAYERPQVLGKAEMAYLETMEPDARKKMLYEYLSYEIPCIIICRNMPCQEDLLNIAREKNVPIYRSRMVTTKLEHNAIIYLNNTLAPRVNRHGVLVDVYGIGVMLMGDSGIGKSECALELIKRGHRLVADDVVDIRRVADDRLSGTAPAMVRHFMEIRGIGIIDIKAMYGIGSVLYSKSIEVIINLELWDQQKAYDRLGLGEEFISILGVKVPKITIPVRPGRNLAIIVELAARNFRLKGMGYNAATILSDRMLANAEGGDDSIL